MPATRPPVRCYTVDEVLRVLNAEFEHDDENT